MVRVVLPRLISAKLSFPKHDVLPAYGVGRYLCLFVGRGITKQVTDAIYEGLDVGSEVRAVAHQGLGDTVLLWDDGRLAGLAICHCGPGTEAGSGTCYVKFGAVRLSPTGGQDFDRLLDACEEMAAEKGLSRLAAGVNTARHEAYRQMLERGFRTDLQGVAMQRPNEPGYNRPGVYLIDDWR
jgi:hypothetical protein